MVVGWGFSSASGRRRRRKARHNGRSNGIPCGRSPSRAHSPTQGPCPLHLPSYLERLGNTQFFGLGGPWVASQEAEYSPQTPSFRKKTTAKQAGELHKRGAAFPQPGRGYESASGWIRSREVPAGEAQNCLAPLRETHQGRQGQPGAGMRPLFLPHPQRGSVPAGHKKHRSPASAVTIMMLMF